MILTLILAPSLEMINYYKYLDEIFSKVSKLTNIDKELLKAIAYTETRYYHHKCPSMDGSIGIMNIRDFSIYIDYSETIEVDCQGKIIELSGIKAYLTESEENNIIYAAKLLKKFLNECNNDLICALRNYGKNEIFVEDVLKIYKEGLNFPILSIKPNKNVPNFKYKGNIYGADCSPQPQFNFVNQFVPASNSNYTDANRPNDYPISKVIVHTTEGSYNGAISWFQNPNAQASAHYVLRSSDGHSTQMVCHNDIAWHAGNWNYNTRSIGIEHEGYINQNGWYTDTVLRISARITRTLANIYGISLIHDTSAILGHSEVPGCPSGGGGGAGCHTDPGPYWDWKYYIALVKGLEYKDTLFDEFSYNFKRGGPYESWWFDSIYGYNGGHHFWTKSWTGAITNWARWTPILPFNGIYKVKVYIPQNSKAYVRYKIYHRNGITEKWIDQNLYNNQWVDLGNYEFYAGYSINNGSVTLGDTTIAGREYERIGFDAIAFIYLGPLSGCIDRIVDDGNPGWTSYGNWPLSSYTGYAGDYRYNYTSNNDSIIYNPQIDCPGGYELRAWIRKGSNRTNQAEYKIIRINGDTTIYLNQYSSNINDTGWVNMGSFCLNNNSKVILYSKTNENSSNIVVISDAIEFKYNQNLDCNISSNIEFKDVYTIKLESNGKIKLNLGTSRYVNIKIYSIDGKKVYEIKDYLKAGYNEIKTNLNSGIYILKFDNKTYKWIVLSNQFRK
ncbi:MAG: N-acetylmuramoyl-L-alanine amidase [candidate division WOR-3 bacterium]